MNERTVDQLLKEIEHLSGVKVRLRWTWAGWYLEDKETGNDYPLGEWKKWSTLMPSEQESICRGLGREHLIVLLGLGASDD